ncbi:hypothetical protein K7432_016707 [Basidiobolus ranarum]|uniref:Uncharacterized protein n=1 Tax=Basidiobolus ranarum TaxID=34480 RepID=A0ABR2WEB1_9FUNG
MSAADLSQFTVGNLFDVSGRVGLITGGGRGIGLMITKALVANGAKVYIASRRLELIESIAIELTNIGPGTCKAIQADLSSKQACESLALRVADHEQHLDFLINNLGVAHLAPLEQFPDEHWDQEYRLNVISVFQLTIACLPLLEASQRQSADPARVINIGSNGAFIHSPKIEGFSYQSSKAAINHLSSILSSHLAGRKINVVCVAPGIFPRFVIYYCLDTIKYLCVVALTLLTNTNNGKYINSEMSADLDVCGPEFLRGIPQDRLGNETDMSGLAIFLCSKAAAYINGSTIIIDGGAILWL